MQAVLRMMKSVARPVLGPIWRRIRPRLQRVFGSRAELDRLSAAWHQHLPALVNAAASVAAVAREQVRMKRENEAALAQLRSEIAQLKGQIAEGRPPARIIAADKLERARASGIKLNLGGGRAPLDGFINVDSSDLPGVDVITHADALPFGPGEVSEIFCSHVLEHFAPEEFERKLLPSWASMLKPGGSLRAVVGDAKAMINAAARGEYPMHELSRSFFAAQDGRPRMNMFTAESLAAAFRAAGLVDIQVIAEGRRNGSGYELEVAARAPAK